MNKNCKHILLALLCMVLPSCSENFNEIYFPWGDVDDNVVSDDNTDEAKVLILPTMYDSDRGLASRGTGPLGTWGEDQDHWLNTEFRVFAFRSKNSYFPSYNSNYANTSSDNRLLWDQRLRIDEFGDLSFVDDNGEKEEHYYHTDKMSKWKFFLFNPDGAHIDSNTYQTTNSSLTATLTLDGKMDIMHSFAAHTQADLLDFENKLTNLKDPERTRVFTENNKNGNLMYSAFAGSLGLQPKFCLNHLLTSFDIFVLGSKTDEMNDFLQILVDDVKMEASNEVTVKLADDSWDIESYNKLVKSGELLQTKNSNHKYDLDIVPRIMQTNKYTQMYREYTDFDILWKEVCERGLYKPDQVVHHVISKDQSVHDTLCHTIMLPPQQSYKISINGKYLLCTEDKGQLHLAQSKECWLPMEGNNYTVELPNKESFLPGMKYNIFIYVYGRTRISVSVSIASPWQKGEDVIIDTE